jgi:hypothetical protein
MSTVLDTLRLKIERADAHLGELKAALGIGPKAVGGPHSHGIGLEDDWTLQYSTDVPIPGPDCGIIVGEALHQFRSVLDHLICALAMRKQPRSVCERFKLQFPIYKDLIDFCANPLVSQGRMQCLLGAREFRFIEESQPYERNRIDPASDPLYILSKLDNVDKHRLVLVFDQRLNISGFFESAAGIAPFTNVHQPVKPGTQVLDVGRPLPNPPFAVHVEDLAPFIVFTETDGICDGKAVFPLLRAMQGIVVTILEGAERFFR